MEFINLTPEWENTALWFAEVLKQHGFERDKSGPIITFIEQIRYLTQTDIDAVQRIIEKLKDD
jgi:hypothetical protein